MSSKLSKLQWEVNRYELLKKIPNYTVLAEVKTGNSSNHSIKADYQQSAGAYRPLTAVYLVCKEALMFGFHPLSTAAYYIVRSC